MKNIFKLCGIISLIVCAGFALIACAGVDSESSAEKTLKRMNQEDFGKGALITTIRVSSAAELNTAWNAIHEAGNYVINADFTGQGDTTNANLDLPDEIEGAGIIISLRGNGTTAISGISYIDNGESVILRNIHFSSVNDNYIFQCRKNSNLTMESGAYVIGGDSSIDVYNSTFTMNDGEISGQSYGVTLSVDDGENCSFTMNGGKIDGNDRGVKVGSGVEFRMYGGSICNNNEYAVEVNEDGEFTMIAGSIYQNTVGGVYSDSGAFTMQGGNIFANGTSDTANSSCGGVTVDSGAFTMENGNIYGNYGQYGGGVTILDENGSFQKTGGRIYGNTSFAKDLFSLPAEMGNQVMVGGELYADFEITPYFLAYRNDTVENTDALAVSIDSSGQGFDSISEGWVQVTP
ncbi:MAG: hypothetical protein FWF29_02820 [Treponema sp.]|nr:hypothetical protein [Treponema sp.]